MNVHCFHLSGFAAGAAKMRFACAHCGSETARSMDELVETYGEECSLTEVLADATCRKCGGAYIIASPDWLEE